MKKILSLFVLLMTIVIGAKAETYKVTYNGSEVSTPTDYFTHDTSGKFNFNTKFNGCTYDGVSYTSGLKFEGNTKITFTTDATATITIVQSTQSANTIKFDGTELAVADAASITGGRVYTIEDVAAGDHTVTRGSGESGLFAITVETAASDVPKITASNASVTAIGSEVAATVEVSVTGANLTGSTLTATLGADAPEGMSVSLDEDEISEGGSISATATVSYTATENANGTATLTFSDGTTTKDVTITYAALVTKSELVSISDAKTWTIPTSASLELTDATTPGKYDEYYTYADIATLNGNDLGTFDGTTLAFSGQYPYRSSNGAQNGNLQFITTVPGTVTVEFSNTGGSNKDRWVKVNDTTGEINAEGTTKRTEDFTVAAGTVTISHVDADGNLSSGLRFYSVTFTPSAVPTTETITIPSDGVLTYVTENALDFSTINGAFKAYVPTSVNEAKTSVATAEVTSVPAGTAVLLKGAEGSYDVEIVASAEAPTANLFLVSDGNVQGADNIFAYSKSALKFKKVASTVTIPAGKCYLQIDGVSGDALDLNFDGEATAVEAIAEANEADAAAPVKVIKNGKLYIGNYNVAGQQVK